MRCSPQQPFAKGLKTRSDRTLPIGGQCARAPDVLTGMRRCAIFWVVHPTSVATNAPTVVLVHGAWADGSSWGRVITELQRAGISVVAAPIPLTTLDDDVNAVKRAIDRTS